MSIYLVFAVDQQLRSDEPEGHMLVNAVWKRAIPGAHEPPKAAKEHRTPHTRVSGSSMYARVPDFLPYMARGRYQPLNAVPQRSSI